ncbi:protocadherin-11 x-linked [Plakobranchus ocellatus]|uniref:Protocadherin-11 x-linked n=1 Tax=Plakobranchus ocellatus TaxID=259542 RepID=A0AAV3ZIF0_9GAST|nr:protocadherin-11 x-linked [Plakobranchus ocellatus]
MVSCCCRTVTDAVPALIVLFLVAIETGRCQQSGPIVFTLEEEQKADTLVGNVAERSNIRANVTPEVFDQLKYQILSSESLRIASLFTINSGTGALLTNAMIDREQVCEATAVVCQLEFDVSVKHGVNVIKLLNIIVVVLDKNDNAPSFQTSELPLSISEGAPVGSEISITGAIDRDAGLNTTITYWMDDSQVFDLQEMKLLDVSVLKIVLLQELDREKEDSYEIKIYAKDGETSSALTGTLAVTITVTDINDHGPVFSQSIFNFTVKESATVGSRVGFLVATDEDAGNNGAISFTFSPLTSSKLTRLFLLNKTSGEITVKSDLQFESGNRFVAVVEAKDQGGSPRATQATLLLTVVDVGNTPPKLVLTLADPLYQNSSFLSEGLPEGSFVGTLKYTDTDEQENGQVKCSSMNSFFALQPLEDNAYAIEIKVQLDREAQNEMLVVLRCSDGGSPSLSSTANFTVYISDINDNVPVFQSSGYRAEVLERVTSFPSLLSVSATDADEGRNSKITYQLSMNSSNAFSIDPFTGWISLISPVDREAGPIIQLTVLAVDDGQPSRLTGSAMVSVYVQDVNDNRPQIIRQDYQVRENQNTGAFVAQVQATDNDVGDNGELSYLLLLDLSGGFSVSETGLITTAKVFDRETADFYTILVEVSDKGRPSLSSTATLSITITDANDHSPQIIYPIPGNDTVTISAGLSPGTVVARADASDADIGKNAKLLYLIAEGNPHKIFSIDNTTGTVFVARRLETSRESSYRLTLSVQDTGSPRLHNKTYLYVNIDFTNATRVGSSSGMEHKYVVIAGVISGVTLAIAIIVIAIILKLRHMDITRCAGRGSKVKAVPSNMGHPGNSVHVKQEGHMNVPVDGAFRSDQCDRDAGFGEDFRGPRLNLESHMSRDFPLGKQVMDHGESHRVVLPLSMDARAPPGHEDMSSDSSADVTTSDSGRGASDTEETPAVGGPAPPTKGRMYGLKTSDLDPTPWVPPRQPMNAGSHDPDMDPPSYRSLVARDTSSMDNLPRAARQYASQKDFSKPRRPPNKVRFSVDDQVVGQGGSGRGREPGQVYWTGGNRESDLAHSKQPSGYGHPGQHEQQPLSTFLDPSNTAKLHPSSRLHTTPQTAQNSDTSRSPVSFTPHNSSTSSFSHPDLHQSLTPAGGLPRQQHKLSNIPARSAGPPNPSYPLLPHQKYHPSHPSSNRVLLPSLNASIDEDEDDGSTTTSGSYAVEDNILNISVEC